MRPEPHIIDAFCYNGEPIALQRLAYLFDQVDAFIIVEARESFSGIPKPFLHFERNSDQFAPFASKIIFHAIDRFPDMPEDWPKTNAKHTWMVSDAYASWWRETYQRDAIYDAYKKHFAPQQKSILLCADCDEIPRKHIFQTIRDGLYDVCHTPIFLEMKFFYYSTKWLKPYHWYKAFIINDRGLAQYSLTNCRVGMAVNRYMPNAGWHFSYFLSIEELQQKVASFSHREYDKHEFTNAAHIKVCFDTGADLFKRSGTEDMQPTPPDVLAEVPDLFCTTAATAATET